ncbi:MAG TPA: hypothetical protein VN495_01695 [Candidatus Paceibacterota bacterium]|nr:hypothetical protein [Candidatus Paceibacterota bacterium]
MKFLIPFFALLLLTGCGPSVSKPSKSTAREVVNKMTYAQDSKTGLCYAVLASKSAWNFNDSSLTITWVPCEQKVLEQINKE